jgi:hypothetical protein
MIVSISLDEAEQKLINRSLICQLTLNHKAITRLDTLILENAGNPYMDCASLKTMLAIHENDCRAIHTLLNRLNG